MSDLLARLIAEGTPAELVAEVAMLIAEKRVADEAIEKRRANDRDRTNRRRGNVTSRDNTGQPVTERDPALSPSSFPQTPNQHPHTHPDNTPAREEVGSKPERIAKPDGVQPQTWADFQTHRKAVKAPLTASAMAGIVREAENAGWTLEAALTETMASGWKSFKAKFVQDRQPPGGPPGRPQHSQPADFLNHYLAKQSGARR